MDPAMAESTSSDIKAFTKQYITPLAQKFSTSQQDFVHLAVAAAEKRMQKVVEACEKRFSEQLGALEQKVLMEVHRLSQIDKPISQPGMPSTNKRLSARLSTSIEMSPDVKRLVKDAVAETEVRLRAELHSGMSAAGGSAPSTPNNKQKNVNKRNSTSTPTAFGPVFDVSKAAKNYDESFAILGGKEVLSKYEEVSDRLRKKVSNKELNELVFSILPLDHRKRKAYSTGPVYQHYVPDFEKLYEKAEDCIDTFGDRIRAVATKTCGKPMIAPLKQEKRAKMKARFKYSNNNNSTAWYRLTDLVRATIIYPDIESMYKGLEAIVEEFARANGGSDIVELNDRYVDPLPGGYRDLQMVVEHEGHMCELQVNTESMIATKESAGHRTYDVRRELVQAVRQGDVPLLKDTLHWADDHLGKEDQLLSVLNDEDRPGSGTLLHEAARQGNDEMIYLLLNKRSEANKTDKEGNTPLHYALLGGFDQAVWTLLDLGNAEWNLPNEDHSPPLLLGLLMLRQRPDDENAARAVCTLAYRAGVEHVEEVQSKVKESLDRKLHNSVDLVNYCADGRLDRIEAELREFANPDSHDRNGTVALVVAAGAGHGDVVKKLLDLKASLDEHGPAALEVAMTEKRHAAVQCLLQSGVSVPSYGDLLATYKSAAGSSVSNFKYAGCCMGPDRKVYCAPFDAPNVCVIDTVTGDVKFLDGAGDGDRKFFGICLASYDKKLYCAPHHAARVLVINPFADRDAKKIEFIDLPTECAKRERKYMAICEGPDQKLYCPPRHAHQIMVIDPKTNTVDYIQLPFDDPENPRPFKYAGIAKGPDDKLYCSPSHEPNVMVIDTETRELSFITSPKLGKEIFKFSGICLGPFDKLYVAPFGALHVMIIDPIKQSLSFVGQLESGTICMYSSICWGPDDKLFFSPENAHNVMVFRAESQQIEFIRSTRLECPSKFVGICYDGEKSLYCAPFNNHSLMFLNSKPVLEVARDHGGEGLVKAFKQSDKTCGHPNSDRIQAIDEVIVTFEPGKVHKDGREVGIVHKEGIVISVNTGSQAQSKKVEVGWRIRAVDGNMEKFDEAFGHAEDGDKPYRVTFAKALDEVIITFAPGPVSFTHREGAVTSVKDGGQAEQEGVEIGWRIKAINGKGENLGDKAFDDVENSDESYTVTFARAFPEKCLRARRNS